MAFAEKYKAANADYKAGVLDFMDFITDHDSIPESARDQIRTLLCVKVITPSMETEHDRPRA